METCTILVSEINDSLGLPNKFKYYKIEIPSNFSKSSKRKLEAFRNVIQDIYKTLTGCPYVMAKFDEIEKYFDQ